MPKCKVCGSRVPDGISECPMCGAVYNKTTSKPVVNNTLVIKQTPVIQNNNEVYSEVETEEDEHLTSTELISYGSIGTQKNADGAYDHKGATLRQREVMETADYCKILTPSRMMMPL